MKKTIAVLLTICAGCSTPQYKPRPLFPMPPEPSAQPEPPELPPELLPRLAEDSGRFRPWVHLTSDGAASVGLSVRWTFDGWPRVTMPDLVAFFRGTDMTDPRYMVAQAGAAPWPVDQRPVDEIKPGLTKRVLLDIAHSFQSNPKTSWTLLAAGLFGLSEASGVTDVLSTSGGGSAAPDPGRILPSAGGDVVVIERAGSGNNFIIRSPTSTSTETPNGFEP